MPEETVGVGGLKIPVSRPSLPSMGVRSTMMRYHGRDIMVRVDKYGLEIWPKGTRDKRRVSWKQIVLNQFPQAVS